MSYKFLTPMKCTCPYTIIGSGRVAKHFAHYFGLLNIPFMQWSRASDPEEKQLENSVRNSECILVLINDDAIENFIDMHPFLNDKRLVHFSGNLSTELAHGAHPLMTFTESLYDLATYDSVPFILDNPDWETKTLLPGLKNDSFYIPKEQKALYHSLCVMSNNFTCMLWDKFFSELHESFKLPKNVAFPYLKQTMKNLQNLDCSPLTGPLVRGDNKTIQSNLASLQNDPFQDIYAAFVKMRQKPLT
ncbi:MAG: putative short-subunit dehydrogenase-like oxidoreductase (DUF2520 family) [Halioglobus sp.]